MRTLGFSFSVLVLLLWLAHPAAGAGELQLPSRIHYVSDYAQVLTDATENDLNELLARVKQETGVEIYILTVLTTEPLPINEFGRRISEAWNLGEEDPNRRTFLFLLAVDDGLYRLITNRGLETLVTDQQLEQISRTIITPAFAEGEFSKGIVGCINQVLRILSESQPESRAPSPGVWMVVLGLGLAFVALVLAALLL